jgi:uncharacterized protein (DUF1697 family)
MKTYIVLLRGVTPVGKSKVPKAELREVLSENGFENVRTWIASGNVLVETALSAREVEQKVHKLIKEQIGQDLVIVVRTSRELQKVLDENPFKEGYNISRVFFVSFLTKPTEKRKQKILEEDFGENEVQFGKYGGYMYLPKRGVYSKLNNNYLEKKLSVSATSRCSNTLRKLIKMEVE